MITTGGGPGGSGSPVHTYISYRVTDNLFGEGQFCWDLCVWTFECI